MISQINIDYTIKQANIQQTLYNLSSSKKEASLILAVSTVEGTLEVSLFALSWIAVNFKKKLKWESIDYNNLIVINEIVMHLKYKLRARHHAPHLGVDGGRSRIVPPDSVEEGGALVDGRYSGIINPPQQLHVAFLDSERRVFQTSGQHLQTFQSRCRL